MSDKSPLDLSGKYALVTGGSRGIGRAISKSLAAQGATVCFNYLRNREAAKEAHAEIASVGPEPIEVRANVADAEHVDRMFGEIGEKFGKLDILVSNAALGVLKPVTDLREKDWAWTMDINARALVKLSKHSIDLMGDRGGSIVGVSSLGSTRAIPFYGAVGASKAALESLVRHLAIEKRREGHPGQRRFGWCRRYRRAEVLPEPRRDPRGRPQAHAGRPTGDARRHGGRRALPRLRPGQDDPRPDDHRRRRNVDRRLGG